MLNAQSKEVTKYFFRDRDGVDLVVYPIAKQTSDEAFWIVVLQIGRAHV